MRRLLRWIWGQFHAIHDDALGTPATGEARPAAAAAGRKAKRKGRGAPAAAPAARPAATTAPAGGGLDVAPLVLFAIASVSLTLLYYYVREARDLAGLARWTGWRLLAYLGVPAVGLLALRRSLPDLGIGLGLGLGLGAGGGAGGGRARRAALYAGLGLAALVFLVIAASALGLSLRQPRLALGPGDTAAQAALLWAAQIVAAEVFYRGILLFGLRRSLGVHAVWATMVPFCMAQHAMQPPGEAFGAIASGIALGTLALRVGSVWPGVFLHVAVAGAAATLGGGAAGLVQPLVAVVALAVLTARPTRPGWIVGDWRAIQAGTPHLPVFDWRPLVVLVVAAVSLTVQEFYGDRDVFAKLWRRPPDRVWVTSHYELASFGWWTGWRVVGYLVAPLVVVLLLPRERLRDYGFGVRGFARHVWIYVGLFVAVLPLVVAVSFTVPFQRTYPFYKLANRSTFDFAAWEVLYALQFLSLEFFFRGFLLSGLRRAIGVHAIWVMIVPYCMIHYGKPLPETLGAIGAGVILGALAMRTRSMWCGVLIHVSVAVTMDALSMAHCPDDRPCLGHGADPTRLSDALRYTK